MILSEENILHLPETKRRQVCWKIKNKYTKITGPLLDKAQKNFIYFKFNKNRKHQIHAK